MFAPETIRSLPDQIVRSRASMRPGHVCPGNGCSTTIGSVRVLCFNEAGACLPRKPCWSATRSTRSNGFNEAGACLPRKPTQGILSTGRRRRASMRPGHVCPGNRRRLDYGGRDATASMRPGHVCPGNAVVVALLDRTIRPASMRPGHVCPGNRPLSLQQRFPAAASMRPGHVCPGNPAAGSEDPRRAGSFNEAGACLPRKPCAGMLGVLFQRPLQ